MQSEMTQKVSWKDTQYAQFTKKPVPEMLKEEGIEIVRNVSIKGESKSKKTRTRTRTVTYDRSYVVAWIAVWLGPLITSISRADLMKLMTEAKALAKTK